MTKFRKNKKGFTLTELIVVMVILAILAAATIPTMLRFVEDARNKAIIAKTRTVYLACQSVYTERFSVNLGYDVAANDDAGNLDQVKIRELSELVTGDFYECDVDGTGKDLPGKVTAVRLFDNATGRSAEFDATTSVINLENVTAPTADKIIINP